VLAVAVLAGLALVRSEDRLWCQQHWLAAYLLAGCDRRYEEPDRSFHM